MCGIAGFLGAASGHMDPEQTIDQMTDTLTHRGPDARGVWSDASAGVWLGHRRLAIIDVSESGNQPMVSQNGRWVLTFNGEIYNFPDLRKELERIGIRFRGTSDTEVFLEAVSRWGLDSALRRSRGQFAFALWDQEKRRLHLARDRLGEKPLYYGWMGAFFLFGSELKALQIHPDFHAVVNKTALSQYLRFGNVPAPHSIWNGIAKLQPGHSITIRPGLNTPLEGPIPYWSAGHIASTNSSNQYSDSNQAIDELDHLLRKNVRRTMMADVPLGVFLSGGIDSSAVTALMQAESDEPVRSFTVRFDESVYNEADEAQRVADHLGTNHTEMTATPDEVLSVVPLIPRIYDEPFADSSQVPTFLIARKARDHVTVALSGDGGDELFGGYNRYVSGASLWRRVRWAPQMIRASAGRALDRMPSGLLESIARIVGGPKNVREGTGSEKAIKFARAVRADDLTGFHESLQTIWPTSVVVEPASSRFEYTTNGTRPSAAWSPEEQMMLIDSVTYLPNDILVKVDRASMNVGLEVRSPFLDPDVYAMAWRLPLSMRVRDGQGKWLLRQVLDRYVPHHLVERPKTGFGVPISSLLRGPLKQWAENLLAPRRMASENYLRPEPIQKAWQEHISGRKDHAHKIWCILMFQAWLETQEPASGMMNAESPAVPLGL